MNVRAPVPKEVFLQPGEYYFGTCAVRIWTLLGSCVSMTFWHPQRKMGGMCHYLLPQRSGSIGQNHDQRLDGRYADEALALLFREMARQDTRPEEYHVKVFGGGNMFPNISAIRQSHVGENNVGFARRMIEENRLQCLVMHTGGSGHRKVIFDVCSGHAWVKHDGAGGLLTEYQDGDG